MDVLIACDHAGYDMKMQLLQTELFKDATVKDMGTHSSDSMDYPDAIHPLASILNSDDSKMGIILCGSGNGVSMTANKYANVRAALCWNEEIASMARQHNNANILSIPARYITLEEAVKCVKAFLNTDFEGGRHQRRVEKISQVC